jgi:hypothetical protein
MSNSKVLIEELGHNQANVVSESIEQRDGVKSLYLSGICIQGEVRNQNGRIYPTSEIRRAVDFVSAKIRDGYSILGEVDHPDTLTVNLDRVSHLIESMHMEGANGMGKLKIINDTPMGQLVKALINSGAKLGVSSRGAGDLDSNSAVSNFEIVTVDIVANPSAQDAYPRPIYESLINMKHGHRMYELAQNATIEERAQHALAEDIIRLTRELNKR